MAAVLLWAVQCRCVPVRALPGGLLHHQRHDGHTTVVCVPEGQRARAASLREIPTKSPVIFRDRPADRPSRTRRGTAPRACSSTSFGNLRSSTSAARSHPPPLPPAAAPIVVGKSKTRATAPCPAQRGAPTDTMSQVRSNGPTARRKPIADAKSVEASPPELSTCFSSTSMLMSSNQTYRRETAVRPSKANGTPRTSPHLPRTEPHLRRTAQPPVHSLSGGRTSTSAQARKESERAGGAGRTS